MFPERIGTPTMHRIGKAGEGAYTPEESQTIDGELNLPWSDEYRQARARRSRRLLTSDLLDYQPKQVFPAISASTALDRCRAASANLPEVLMRICLDPKINLEERELDTRNFSYSLTTPSVWWFKDLISALHEYRLRSIEQAKASIANTTISSQIHDDLDYCLHCRGFVIIEGEQRTGKSTAAKVWCDMHPGQAIYIRLESGIDEATYFRAIGRAIGTACSIQRKSHEMRMRVEDMLQEGHLLLVIDEAHFHYGQTVRPRSAPARVNWVRTALLDHKVGVAWISTPQFDRQCALYEKHVQWNAKQMKGRVKLHRLLPNELPAEDLAAVARKMAPTADAASIERLVGFAEGSDDYLAGIERLTDRASFFAARDGRTVATAADIKRALNEAMPTLHVPEVSQPAPRQTATSSLRAVPLRAEALPAANTLPAPLTRRLSKDSPASSQAGFGASERLQFDGAAAPE